MKLCSLTSREIFFSGFSKGLVRVSLLEEGSSRCIKKLQKLIGGFKFCTKFRIKKKYYGKNFERKLERREELVQFSC
jgi:hypothetical protein